MNIVLYFQSKSKTSAPAKLAGVLNIAKMAHWQLQTIDEIPDRTRFLELVAFWHPRGCIVECGVEHAETDPSVFNGVPTVFLDRNPDTLPRNAFSVSHDSRATGEMAARELLMSGCSDFIYVHPQKEVFWSRERESGFRDALALNGKTCRIFRPLSSHKPQAHNFKIDPIEYQRQLRAFLKDIQSKTAIFAANDRTAAEVLTALAAISPSFAKATEGKRPSQHISLIGVDNYVEICEHTNPPLTSIEPDFQGGGETAAIMLMAILRDGEKFRGEHHRMFGPLRVVRRASTHSVHDRDPELSAALDRIAAEACQGLTAADVLTCFSCSRDTAEIRFRRETGKSILEAIHGKRLERAKDLLRDPGIQIKAISDFCGFENPNSLCKFFRKATGNTMSYWRQSSPPLTRHFPDFFTNNPQNAARDTGGC